MEEIKEILLESLDLEEVSIKIINNSRIPVDLFPFIPLLQEKDILRILRIQSPDYRDFRKYIVEDFPTLSNFLIEAILLDRDSYVRLSLASRKTLPVFAIKKLLNDRDDIVVFYLKKTYRELSKTL